MITHDASEVRTSLFFASLAFKFKTGDLGAFETTFMFHLGDCIRTINRWLTDLKTSANATCLRLVATLCYVEV